MVTKEKENVNSSQYSINAVSNKKFLSTVASEDAYSGNGYILSEAVIHESGVEIYSKAKLIEVVGELEKKSVRPPDDGANFANLLICPEPLRAPIPRAEPYPVEKLGVVLGAAATALHETIKAPLALCCQSVLVLQL